MRRGRVFAGLMTVLAVASATVAPQAVAAACQYTVQDLPLPAVAFQAEMTGSSTNNSRIVGVRGETGSKYGLLWVNNVLREMPGVSQTDVIPAAVNNVSVVAGRQEHRPAGSDSVTFKAFRYEAGVYTMLETEPGEQSWALGINDAGDVVGLVAPQFTYSYATVVMWPRSGPRKTFGVGYPRGIDAQRRIVMLADSSSISRESGWVVDTDTGAKVELPGAQSPLVFDNGRVLNFERLNDRESQITEWDLTGTKVAAHAGGVRPFGRNGSGTVFGTDRSLAPTLWRPSGRTVVQAPFLPMWDHYGEITDAATLIGTYTNADRHLRPARWLWVCS
ncbi:hypothetical protein [Lentzea flaviverrucosa]|uniref:Uncharacterized protein n=1 Tax=Lentzea flaviverrucosa TaxID=200379 RepID=A0A1H9CLR1_9PSEU|nr:hypothetical protein [Lentzea flaviverrucosa]RDI24573.1 hypothetical protein DFR72_109153 [Lentzea flaviverrucosa]SEQ01623.1 hypothetical protein SAMN05216195_101808 [Lentzea flaviverrucosa]